MSAVSDSPIEHQKRVLTSVIDEAVREELVSDAEAEQLRRRLDSIESMASIDRFWNDLCAEYELLEPA